MNKIDSLRSKWDDLETHTKRRWTGGAVLFGLLFSWQLYSNYQYHQAQAVRSTAAAINKSTPTLPRGSAIAGNSLSEGALLSSSYLPQTSRNLGLEDLKADFDNTRQLFAQAKEEMHQLVEQNKVLQNKVTLLEQSRAGEPGNQLRGAPTSINTAASMLHVPLPVAGDFNQADSAELLDASKEWGSASVAANNKRVPPNATSPSPAKDASAQVVLNKHAIKQWSTQTVESLEAAPKQIHLTIPATAVIEAVMLSGINARTSATGGTTGGSIVASNNVGSPFISRVKGAAILPNGWRVADLTDCFLSGTGIGILSTERANVTADRLTCVDQSGLIFESKIKAYGVDLDGIQGLSGRLVTKQGSILAKEAAAGMLAGVGSAFSPQALPSYNSNATSGSQQGFVLPNTSLIAGSAVGQGVSTSLGQLSKFYLDYARQMFPIVEVNAGTRVSWVVQESFDLVRARIK